jgi:hypothetical protein
MRVAVLLSSLLAIGLAACAQAPARSTAEGPSARAYADVVRTGVLTHADLATYKAIPFDVPAGADNLAITVEHDGKDVHSIIDLGLADPAGFRGWSGSNKTTLFLSAFEATPSFRAGPLLPGRWTLIFGIPAIREGVTTHWKATIRFNRAGLAPSPPPSPAWRRGDFHAHTGHSDGSCSSQSGKSVPCPVHETLDAAVRAHLDFVSVTDHNTYAQNETLRELEPFYDKLTIVRGAEITTFLGHANAIGIRTPVDFRLGTPKLVDTKTLLDRIDAQGGLLSLSHPGLASGEQCMGCGWTAPIDYNRLTGIEIVNGGALRDGKVETPTSGILFWEKLLNQGFHLTGIGGSDNHDGTARTSEKQSPVGLPATVVWTHDPSERAIVAGVKSGRVFVDLQNRAGSLLDVETRHGGETIAMGGTLTLNVGESAAFTVTATGADDGRVEIVSGGLALTRGPDDAKATFTLAQGARFGWVRANVRAGDGKLLMVSNPVYVKAR